MKLSQSATKPERRTNEPFGPDLANGHQAGPMPYQYDDGGRAAAGYKGSTRDCVCRSISIACGLPYQVTYNDLNELAQTERITKRRRRKSNARTGVHNVTTRKYLARLGWKWVPTMHVGQGCKVHLRSYELPSGRLIVQVSRHLVAVIDGIIHDTHDCSSGGDRSVYGYYKRDESDRSDYLTVVPCEE